MTLKEEFKKYLQIPGQYVVYLQEIDGKSFIIILKFMELLPPNDPNRLKVWSFPFPGDK